jgi:hypothetical protein
MPAAVHVVVRIVYPSTSMRTLLVLIALATLGCAAGADQAPEPEPARSAAAQAPAAAPAPAPRALTLGIAGRQFTVNGTPRFLTFVSYFDALDATALDGDLARLARSVDGIRIFANWWDLAGGDGCRFTFSPRTLFEARADGSIGVRADRLERLRDVLARARHHGLVVDLTFAADPIEGASNLTRGGDGRVCPPAGFRNEVRWPAMAAAIGETTRALARPEFDHVFFDLQNEAGHDYNRARPQDLRLLVDAARKADSSRLISVSMFNPDADRQAAIVGELGLSMLNFHDVPRGRGWGARTGGHVRRFRAALTRAGLDVPIYAGEPDRQAYGRGIEEFMESLAGAKAAGAAAWTFHTTAAYDLRGSSLDGRMDGTTRQVLAALAGGRGPG